MIQDIPVDERNRKFYASAKSIHYKKKGTKYIMYHSIRPGQVWLDTEGKESRLTGVP